MEPFQGRLHPLTATYMMDRGTGHHQMTLTEDRDFTGWSNQCIIPELNDQLILEHLQNLVNKDLYKMIFRIILLFTL